MNHADLYHPELAQLCIDLRETLAHVYANLYLTPPRSQAVKAHTDDQDVIILQVSGSKVLAPSVCPLWRSLLSQSWTIYDAPVTLPYTHEMVGKTGPERAVTQEMKSHKIEDVLLKPGDLLYLPRGLMHEARTEGSDLSLHLTLTVPSHDFTWAKFGAHAITELLMEETGSLRSMVRADTLVGGAPGDEQERAILDQILEVARAKLSLEGAQHYFAKKIAGHNKAQERVCASEEYSGILPRQIRPKSLMRIKRGMQLEFDDSQKSSALCRLIVRNEGRVLEQAVDREHITIYHAIAATRGEMFSAQELPGDGYSQICVCKLLLRQEVIEIREDPSSYPSAQQPQHNANQSKIQSNPGMPAIAEEEDEGELLYSG